MISYSSDTRRESSNDTYQLTQLLRTEHDVGILAHSCAYSLARSRDGLREDAYTSGADNCFSIKENS